MADFATRFVINPPFETSRLWLSGSIGDRVREIVLTRRTMTRLVKVSETEGPGACCVLGSVVAATLLLTGCEGDPGAAVISDVDSAGVRIVESYEPVWSDSSPWELVPTPALDLTESGEGTEHEFFRVTDAVRFPDGRFVVANDGTSEVRFYTAEGRFLTAVGRNGDGPGEFRRIRTLSRMRGDSVAVYDPLLNRLTVLGPDGSTGRVMSLLNSFPRVRQLRAYSDSTFLGLAHSFAMGAALGRYRVPYSLVRLRPDGTVLDTLAVIGGYEGFETARVDTPLPYSKNGHLAIRDGEFVLGDADSLAFERFSGPGVQSQSVSVPGYNLALTRDEIDSRRWALLHRADGRSHPPSIQEAMENIPIPDHKPGYSRLLLDTQGYVWAARYKRRQTSPQSEEWEVFAPSGEWLGSLATPPGFTVLRIGADGILGVQRDDFDVEHVQSLTLIRSN